MITSRTDIEPMSMVELQPAGRRMRSIALHAVTTALAYKLVPLFAPAVLIAAGLRNGWRVFAGALAGAFVILAIFGGVLPAPARTAELADAVRLLCEIGATAAVAVALLRRRLPGGQVVIAAVAASAAGFLLTELVVQAAMHYSIYSTLLGEMHSAAADLVKAVRDNPAANADHVVLVRQVTEAISGRFLPTLLATIWIAGAVFSVVLVPRLAYQVSGTGQYLFRKLQFPEWLLVLFVVSGLSPLLAEPYQTIGYNVLAIVVFCYMTQGLAIYRSLLARLPIGVFGLIAAFALLFVLMQAVLPIVLLALAGLFDPFFDFRHLHRKEMNDESNSD